MSQDLMISALGATVRLSLAGIEQPDREELRRIWADAAAPTHHGSRAGARTPTAAEPVSLSSAMRREQLLAVSAQRVTHAAIEARRGDLWMLHAGGVADDEGNVVVLIGPSGRGKTTAVRTLAQRYAYVSDETIGIDADGRVFPYRKPLSIIESVGAVKAQRSPSELGLRALPEASLQVAALVLLDRRADSPDAAVVERCDFGDAIEELVGQTSYLADLRAPLQTLAAHVRAVGGVHRVIYREAESLVDGLAPLFRTPLPRNVAEADAEADALVRHLTAAPDSADATSADGWYRAPVLDALALRDPTRLMLMQTDGRRGATLRVLGGLGPTLWRGAAGRSTRELTEIAISAHGTPAEGEAGATVARAVAELAAQGVLTSQRETRGEGGATPAETASQPGME